MTPHVLVAPKSMRKQHGLGSLATYLDIIPF